MLLSSSNRKYPPFPLLSYFSVVVYVQLAHCSSGDWNDISIAHVIIIIKSEVSTFPIVIIFFRGCMTEMFTASYFVIYCIYIPGKRDFVSIITEQFIICANNRILIWRHWTYKMPVRYILSSVWVRLRIFSQSSIIQYMGLCVFSLPISLVIIARNMKYELLLIV